MAVVAIAALCAGFPSRAGAQRALDLPPPACGNVVDYRECDRRSEARIIERDRRRVQRSADTLTVRFGTRTARWIDAASRGEGTQRYFYVGTIRAAGDHQYAVVRRDGYEASEFIIASWTNGDTALVLPGAPLISPDRRRVVGSTVGIDVEFALDVWRLNTANPEREFTARWADDMPVDTRWVSGTEVRFGLRARTLGAAPDSSSYVRVRLRRTSTTAWTLDTLSSSHNPSERTTKPNADSTAIARIPRIGPVARPASSSSYSSRVSVGNNLGTPVRPEVVQPKTKTYFFSRTPARQHGGRGTLVSNLRNPCNRC